jgi:UDPglucose 6-dehydrogenase
MNRPAIVDLRNIYRTDDMARHGFTYVSIGRADEVDMASTGKPRLV